MNRRDFLKIVGISTVGATAALSGCAPDKKETSQGVGEVPVGKMTYRQFPPNEDKVSLLGYGCMRWPTLPAPGGDGNVIDQEEVNRLVDYAIEHGVNYFDTAPVYVQGWSETSTGIALKRHPREKFFVATKMSNFSNSDYDFGVKMYHNSMKKLQVDYIDYYLLHMLGAPGKRGLQGRFWTTACSTFCSRSARPDVSVIWAGRSMARRRNSTGHWPCTTRYTGISFRFS